MWQFKSYIETCFFGQEEVINGIHYLVDAIENGENYNFLFRAPSGYGKTYLARRIGYFIYLKTNVKSAISFTGDKYKYYREKRFQLIDEVHLLKDTERVYPLMDSNQHTFMLMSNEYSDLLEPLVNRCFVFNFTGYSREELSTIAYKYLVKHNYSFGEELLLTIVDNSRLMPREIINLCKRLLVIFRQEGKPETVERMEEILFNYTGIRKGGFTAYDISYLEFLEEHERASLNTLATVLQIPRQTILNEVEPFLMRRNLIRISPRGRVLNTQEN
jgi:Holliday junction DNA helicase RuvB